MNQQQLEKFLIHYNLSLLQPHILLDRLAYH